MAVPVRRSLIVPFRELQPSLRQLRRIYRGTRAVLMGEEVARDPTRSHRPVAHHHAPHRAECRPHTLAGGHPPRRRHLSGVDALAGHWDRDPCTICPGNARLLREQCGRYAVDKRELCVPSCQRHHHHHHQKEAAAAAGLTKRPFLPLS
eukprot:scaffold45461_cov62-Phaeocystis_antarctica.AAC.11